MHKQMSLTDEYFNYYNKYKEEYGEKTCILMQIGSFYEIKMIKNEDECTGNLNEISRLLNIQMTKANKSIEKVDRKNPYMGGFPIVALSKFLPVLMDNGYTTVVINQKDKVNGIIQRKVDGIYSSGIRPILDDNQNENGLTSVYMECINEFIIFSIVNLNIATNKLRVVEDTCKKTEILDELYKRIISFKNTEIIINVKGDINIDNNDIINYLELNNVQIHFKEITKEYDIYYKNEYLRNAYKNVKFGMLEPIEYFNLEKTQTIVDNMIILIEFINKHESKYSYNISIPELINEKDYLLLEMNTIQQLAILPTNNKCLSLFDLLDKTVTSIGKRRLKELLVRPYKNVEEINKKYTLNEQIDKVKDTKTLDKYLNEICDFERLHRKMALGSLHPYEFYKLNNVYTSIIEIQRLLCKNEISEEFLLSKEILNNFMEYCSEYNEIFNMELLQKYNLNDNNLEYFLNSDKFHVLSELFNKIITLEKKIEEKRVYYEKLLRPNYTQADADYFKLVYTEDSCYLLTTKIRSQQLSKICKNINIKTNTSSAKIYDQSIEKDSLEIINNRELFSRKIKKEYLKIIFNFSEKYNNLFISLKKFIEEIDLGYSNVKCKRVYNYCLPKILPKTNSESENSYIKCVSLRHPIIEKINNNLKYIPNDITLDDASKGIVLYALNACGKSSLLRSVGICVIMAQCGMYVACSDFEYYPFDVIISQVELNDNLWRSQSSFVSEMMGLRRIMSIANSKCLVLSDELTKGTEAVSATSIFAAAVLELIKLNSKFIFTTHLTEISKLEIIKKEETLKIKNLSIRTENDSIIFERKLKDGPCDELYGLEVAKSVGLPKKLMEMSFEIRNELVSKKQEILKNKRSRYNSKKIVDKCEICEYSPGKKTDIPLDVHHINFQCTANENNFIDHFHKNKKFNLVVLCKKCHIDVHLKKITIHDYTMTSDGVKLQFDTN